MKSKQMVFMFWAVILLTGVFVTGCASAKTNLEETGQITIERVPTKGTYVSEANVYQDGDELVITGKVKNKHTHNRREGYVEIKILDPDGKVIESVNSQYFPRNIRKKGKRESSFTVKLSLIPPKGSVIRLTYR